MHEALSRTLFDRQTKEISQALLDLRGWKGLVIAYPVIEVSFVKAGRAELRVRMRCDEWNDRAPSVELLKADGSRLTSGSLGEVVNPGDQFHSGPHEATGFPFICMAGTLEYHTHSSHVSDHWQNYKQRDAYTLGGILSQIWRAWEKKAKVL